MIDFEEAADRCQSRIKDAQLENMPTVLIEELKSRRDYFLARAKEVRK